jgi:hypothetical protein
LKSYEKNKAAQDQLDNLKGAQFNQSFLKWTSAITRRLWLRRARSEFSGDPDVLVYIDETIPVLEGPI